jgi:hypothetical protein
MSIIDIDVLVPRKEYDKLISDQRFLEALLAAGVDNWDGYDYALEINEEINKDK